MLEKFRLEAEMLKKRTRNFAPKQQNYYSLNDLRVTKK